MLTETPSLAFISPTVFFAGSGQVISHIRISIWSLYIIWTLQTAPVGTVTQAVQTPVTSALRPLWVRSIQLCSFCIRTPWICFTYFRHPILYGHDRSVQ